MQGFFSGLTSDRLGADRSIIQRSLEQVRQHLGMDVAYFSEIVGDVSTFRNVDAPGLEHLAAPGDTRPLNTVYCQHILEGRLPELIPDTTAEPLAMSMPITHEVPIGAHVSVPVRRANGEVYGMFCCLSATPRSSLNARDLHIVRAFAGLVAEEVERDCAEHDRREAKATVIRQVLRSDGLAMVLQPICRLSDRRVVGFEALARFDHEPQRSPDLWFADAAEVGLGVELECVAIAAALELLPSIPEPLTLSLNASPATVTSGALAALLARAPADRLILELTEHAGVADYALLCGYLDPLRAGGVKLAVDDAGAGFSSLQHILKLKPDYIKLDISLVREIDTDGARQALAAALLLFARNTGAVLVAEGVETPEEFAKLKSLGVSRGQGYLLGRPARPAQHGSAALAASGR